MKYTALFSLFLLALCCIDNIYASSRRGGGGSRGSSSGGSSSRSHGSYSSHGHLSSSSSGKGTSSYISPSYSSSSHSSSSHNVGKSASNDFIRSESSSHQTSPVHTSIETSGYGSPIHTQPSGTATAGKPAWSNPYFPNSNTHQTASADKPSWSNPHFSRNTHQPTAPVVPPHTGNRSPGVGTNQYRHSSPFNSTHSSYTPKVTENRNTLSSPWNTTHGGPGFATSHQVGNVGTSGFHTPTAPPYPMGGTNMPHPTNVNSGHIGFNPSITNPPYNPAIGHPSYNPAMGHPSYNPAMGQPSYNPSMGHPSYNTPGYPTYHPSMGYSSFGPGTGHPSYYPSAGGAPFYQSAQPASGPVIVMAGQPSSSSRGLGQIIAEAAVFSAVNVGVNRLLSPQHHHSYNPATSAGSSTTTHITYNNQYFNGQPVDNNQFPGSPQSNFPGGTFGNTASYPTNIGSGSTFQSNPIGVNNAMPGSTSSIPGANYVPTGSNNINIPAPGVVTNVGSSNNVTVTANSTAGITYYGVSNEELWKLTEDLFVKQEYNTSEFITLNLQKQSNTTDDVASKPLLTLQKEAYILPTVQALRKLYDNYESDSRVKENRTLEKRQKENILLDTFMNTDVMNTALRWLTSKNFIDPDDFEKKDTLSHIWFNVFDGTSSGFERVFVSETLHSNSGAVILGVQDWVNFDYLESSKRIDYLGYVDKVDLGDNASLVKLNYKMNDLVVSNTTIFIGTLPELEMALYTVCFYARPGMECSVSLAGTKVNVYTHLMPYFGKYLLVAAYPSV